MASEGVVSEGTLSGGLPYLRLGSGPHLVVLRDFTTTHDNPRGLQRPAEVGLLKPLARRFDVYAVNRAPGLPAGTTMAQIASVHADAFRQEFGEPVDLLGMSSGGSRLDDVKAPTLVIGGERDNVYGADLLRATAEGVRDGRLLLYPGASHASTMTSKRLWDDVAEFLSAP